MLASTKNQNSIFSCQQEANSLIYRSQTFTFGRGEIIPQASHNLWLIKIGIVKTITWTETGKTTVLGYWGIGDIVGNYLSSVNPYEVECLSGVEAICIPEQNGKYFFREISNCIKETDELLRIIRTEKMYFRLLKLLDWLAKKFGNDVLEGTLIDIRITHQELADLMGSTRVTITRLLNQLEKEKIIARPRRFAIVISDLNRLEQMI